MLTKQNEVLFDITSQRDDGVFVLKLHTTEDDQITSEEEDSNFFGSLLGGSKIVNVKGSVFGSGGLYDFKVIITTGDDYSNVISPPLDYDVVLKQRYHHLFGLSYQTTLHFVLLA